MDQNKIELFEGKSVRRVWHNEQWFFSVVDVVEVLTDSPRPRKYWNSLKTKLSDEGSQLSSMVGQLKLPSKDGKMYSTDVLNLENIFRLIQSIPSKKAEPFKQWLARVGTERVQEIADPELALKRSRDYWMAHGRSAEWVQRRMMGQEVRNKLTDYWQDSGVREGREFAILTNIIHKEWTGLDVANHKKLKGLKNQNLRDHMSEAEVLFTALAELSTRQIAEAGNAKGLTENIKPAKAGGAIAKSARLKLEQETGKPVVTKNNYLPTTKSKKGLK